MTLLVGGAQKGIPLSLLAVKDGKIDASRLGGLATDAAPLLAMLLASGAIEAGETSAPIVALSLRAKTPGVAGNTLTLKFEDVEPKTPPGDSIVKVRLVYEDRRKGLTKNSMAAELGTPGAGTKPGLVALKAAPAGPPKALAATKLSGTPLELDIPAKTGTAPAFTVQATGTEAMFADVKVAIIEVDSAGPDTFTLVISVDHTETGLQLDDLDAAFGSLVEIVGIPAAAPAKGEIKLAGGANPETSEAKAAEAAVLSD